MNNFYKGAFILVLSALGFSLLPIFALYAYKGNINITTLLVFRFSLAAVIFFIYVFIKYKKLNINKKDILFLFILGGICYNLQARFYFTSVKYISASLAALFLYTFPVMVTILSFIIEKEKITKKLGVSICISFIGLIMILGTSIGKINGFGILMGLGAAFVYSIYIMIGNRMLKKIPPLITSAFVALFSSVTVLSTGLVMKDISFNFEKEVWFPILGLVLFSTVLAILTFFKGMELLGPTKASIISMLEPVFTVIFSAILLYEHMTVLQLIGGTAVLAGALSAVWSKNEHENYEK
jgi:drug/metabolite transporter (DMT)-like permease